nr:MAG TPA: hypothetical protein [Caudoviricetes sp.]
MILDKILIFLLLTNLIVNDVVNKRWTVWLWILCFVLQVILVITKLL